MLTINPVKMIQLYVGVNCLEMEAEAGVVGWGYRLGLRAGVTVWGCWLGLLAGLGWVRGVGV